MTIKTPQLNRLLHQPILKRLALVFAPALFLSYGTQVVGAEKAPTPFPSELLEEVKKKNKLSGEELQKQKREDAKAASEFEAAVKASEKPS